MVKKSVFIIFFLFQFFHPAIPCFASWQIETPLAGAYITATELEIDALGRIHLVAGGRQLYWFYWDGSSLQQETLAACCAGEYFSLVLDKNEQPAIAYYQSSDKSLNYMHRAGNNWHSEIIDNSGDCGKGCALSFNSLGDPAISYFGNEHLKFASKTSRGWEISTIDASGLAGNSTSLAFNADDLPAIAYIFEGRLKYAFYDEKEKGWHIESGALVSFTSAECELKFTPDGKPAIVYQNLSNQLWIALRENNSWLAWILDSQGGLSPSLIFDQAGNANISYIVNDDEKILRYAHFNGSFWEFTDVLKENHIIEGADLEILPNNQPALSFLSAGAEINLNYAEKQAEGWVFNNITSTAEAGLSISLAFDSEGSPLISSIERGQDLGILVVSWLDNGIWFTGCLDANFLPGFGTSFKINSLGQAGISYSSLNALKFAYFENNAWNIEIVDEGVWVGEYSSLAYDSINRPGIAYFADGELRFAQKYLGEWQVHTVESGSWKSGISLVFNYFGIPIISYYDADYDVLKCAYLITSSEFNQNSFLSLHNKKESSFVYSSEEWVIQIVDDTPGAGIFSSIALNNQDLPGIAYFTYQGLKYAFWENGYWLKSFADKSYGAGLYCSLIFDNNNLDKSSQPQIAYYHNLEGSLKFAYLENEQWLNETVDDGSGSRVGLYTSLALDREGKPAIAYQDFCRSSIRLARFSE